MCICSTYCLQFHLENWVIFLCLESGDAGIMFEWMALYLNIVIIMMMMIIIISEVLFIATLSC